ncbi:MAG: hypothetical protein JHC33_15120 [Ignisphaera sp.]|nr:hypothetical protein [Ignisphaera sp.]
MKKSVITLEHQGTLYYLMDNKGRAWSDDITDAKQHRGMAKTRHKKIKEELEFHVRNDSKQACDVWVRLNNSSKYSNHITISYQEIDTVELRELFLSI